MGCRGSRIGKPFLRRSPGSLRSSKLPNEKPESFRSLVFTLNHHCIDLLNAVASGPKSALFLAQSAHIHG